MKFLIGTLFLLTLGLAVDTGRILWDELEEWWKSVED